MFNPVNPFSRGMGRVALRKSVLQWLPEAFPIRWVGNANTAIKYDLMKLQSYTGFSFLKSDCRISLKSTVISSSQPEYLSRIHLIFTTFITSHS